MVKVHNSFNAYEESFFFMLQRLCISCLSDLELAYDLLYSNLNTNDCYFWWIKVALVV